MTSAVASGESSAQAAETRVVLAQIMLPSDANPGGIIHGGVIMKCIDNAAAVVATRHARSTTVTASIDRLDFFHPVHVGNLLILKASLNLVGRTSMEVGVRVEAEDMRRGEVRHIASAYLTFVALDDAGKPRSVPPFAPSTPEGDRRQREAAARRSLRLAEREKERLCQENPDQCPI